MKLVAVLAHCLVAVLAVPSGRIINGSLAKPLQFPYQALITSVTDSGNIICSGAIISSDWILTAGHCVVGARNGTIAVGSTALSGQSSLRVVVLASRYVIHDGYEESSVQNNIALIKLVRPMIWYTNVLPVRLPKVGWSGDGIADVSGWGTTSSKCALTYGTKMVTDDIICAVSSSGTGKRICDGDNGAPLVVNASTINPVLIGIGNFWSGIGCESPEPSGFTRVSYFLSWISNITGI